MKTVDGYRFSLQFKAESEAHTLVGDFLETLKNRKSEVVVAAVLEYIKAHPEISDTNNEAPYIRVTGFSRDTIRELLKELVDEKLAGIALADHSGLTHPDDATLEQDPDDDVISALLDNLEKFS